MFGKGNGGRRNFNYCNRRELLSKPTSTCLLGSEKKVSPNRPSRRLAAISARSAAEEVLRGRRRQSAAAPPKSGGRCTRLSHNSHPLIPKPLIAQRRNQCPFSGGGEWRARTIHRRRRCAPRIRSSMSNNSSPPTRANSHSDASRAARNSTFASLACK